MLNLDKFITDVLECIGIPYVSPGYTGTRTDIWKITYDDHGRPIKTPTISGIDCSGLLVRAYAMQGAKLFHGSNYIWRNDLTDKGKLTSEKQLSVGMAVFKWSKTGEPSKYASDGLGNFHHIGVVTSVNPLTITHASSASMVVKQDTVIGKWTHWGKLKAIDYEGKEEPQMQNTYVVVAPSGTTVNLRKTTSTVSDVIAKVPVGSTVKGIPCTTEGWTKIEYGGTTGYMMSKFLEKKEDDMSLEERVTKLEERVAALEGGVG